jgi:hypothetical protein
MTTDLADLLHDRLDALEVPAGDLAAVERRGRRMRRRRAVPVVAAAAGVAAVLGLLLWPGDGDDRSGRGIEPVGPLDLTHGLRAYGDPGGQLHLGDRTFPAGRLGGIDTDGAATPWGVVFYDHGVPSLLPASGEPVALETGAVGGGFVPTAKADSIDPLIAYGTTVEGMPTIVVRSLESGAPGERWSLEVPADAVIDAVDDGTVLFRTSDGTRAWDVSSDVVTELAGPDTRVADVRNGVVLYDGPVPDGPAAAAYRLVPGAVDAQLTHDGRHVLYWSRTLESTDGDRPIVLDRKGSFFTVDTDGSILMAAGARGEAGASFYDCEVPSGRCEELGTMTMTGGDPMFVGNDM